MKVNFLNFSDPKDYKYFLITGGELILKQEVVEQIFKKLKNAGFSEKISISQDELESLHEIVSKNIGGSLFQENLIIHIKHTSGKFPEKIKSLLEGKEIFKSPNIAVWVDNLTIKQLKKLKKKLKKCGVGEISYSKVNQWIKYQENKERESNQPNG